MQVVPRLFTVTSAGSSEPPSLPLTSPPPKHAVLTSSPSAHFNSPNINYENQKAGADGSVRASHGSGLLEALLAKSSPKPRGQRHWNSGPLQIRTELSHASRIMYAKYLIDCQRSMVACTRSPTDNNGGQGDGRREMEVEAEDRRRRSTG